MPPSGMPHWSNTSERSTYRVPNLEWISVKSSPHFVVVWSAERKRECSIFVELLDEACPSDKHLARRPRVVGECPFAQFYQRGLPVEGVILEGVVGLVPDTTGEQYLLILLGVGDDGFVAEEEVLLHSHPHVDDGGLLLVGEAPSHLLVGDFHECGLLYLGFENLAVVGLLFGKCFELGRHNVEFGGGPSHPDELGTCGDGGHISLAPSVEGCCLLASTLDGVVVAAYHIQYQRTA